MEYLQYLNQIADVNFGIQLFVLNLVISGIPSIHFSRAVGEYIDVKVLNLVISGIPSIQWC